MVSIHVNQSHGDPPTWLPASHPLIVWFPQFLSPSQPLRNPPRWAHPSASDLVGMHHLSNFPRWSQWLNYLHADPTPDVCFCFLCVPLGWNVEWDVFTFNTDTHTCVFWYIFPQHLPLNVHPQMTARVRCPPLHVFIFVVGHCGSLSYCKQAYSNNKCKQLVNNCKQLVRHHYTHILCSYAHTKKRTQR